MRRVLNTDCTDYTDNLFGDADSSLSSVMRSVFEHGLHGLHGFFFCLETRISLLRRDA